MNDSDLISVLIVEDDEDFQYLIRQTLEGETDMIPAGCCQTAEQALSLTEQLRPDVVLMDLALSGSPADGIEASRNIRLQTDAKLLLLSSYEDSDTVIHAAVRGLAHGYLFKSQFEGIVPAIRKTAAGMTPQQHMIRSLILSCLSPAEHTVFKMMLGEEVNLHSSPKTIANQKTMVLKKLDLPSQNALIHIFGR